MGKGRDKLDQTTRVVADLSQLTLRLDDTNLSSVHRLITSDTTVALAYHVYLLARVAAIVESRQANFHLLQSLVFRYLIIIGQKLFKASRKVDSKLEPNRSYNQPRAIITGFRQTLFGLPCLIH